MYLQYIFFFKIVLFYFLFSIGIDFIKNLPIILPILLSVAFFTVLERKATDNNIGNIIGKFLIKSIPIENKK